MALRHPKPSALSTFDLTAISVFVTTLDGVTASFKAGKDLAVGDGGSTSTVEMEPKLPVG